MTSSENHNIPEYVIANNATDSYLALEPPISESEQSELEYYHQGFGSDGVLAALHFFAEHRSTVLDPTYPGIMRAFHPGSIAFTDEELATIKPLSVEENEAWKAKYDAKSKETGEMMDIWHKEGIHSPLWARRKVKEIREAEGDEAADEYEKYLRLNTQPPTPEEEAAEALYFRRYEADKQRAWQALPDEEQRYLVARHRVFLFQIMRGDFYEEKDY